LRSRRAKSRLVVIARSNATKQSTLSFRGGGRRKAGSEESWRRSRRPRDARLPEATAHPIPQINSVLPPKPLGSYPVFVPRADNDGMSISGIRMLPLAVPRAT